MSESVYIANRLKEISRKERGLDEKVGIVLTTPKYCIASPSDFSALSVGLFSLMLRDSIISSLRNIKNPKITEEATCEIDELAESLYEERGERNGLLEVMNLQYNVFVSVANRETFVEAKGRLEDTTRCGTLSEAEQTAVVSTAYTKKILEDMDRFLKLIQMKSNPKFVV